LTSLGIIKPEAPASGSPREQKMKETDALLGKDSNSNTSNNNVSFAEPVKGQEVIINDEEEEEEDKTTMRAIKTTRNKHVENDYENENDDGDGYIEPKTPRMYDLRFGINDWRRFGAVHLFACALFNIFTLGVYGVLQERIMTIPYESNEPDIYADAVFESSIFLVFSNRCWALFVGAIALMYTKPQEVSFFSKKWWWPHSTLENYACVAFSNIVSTLCQYEVLKYLSYAISTLAKAAKILPTMVWGYFLHGRRFSNTQFVSALFVTAGCFVFVFNSTLAEKFADKPYGVFDDGQHFMTRASHNRTEIRDYVIEDEDVEDSYPNGIVQEDQIWKEVREISPFQQTIDWFRDTAKNSLAIGSLIMLIFLAADGFTSSFQQRMFRVQKTSLFDQMFWTCVFGTFFSAIWVIASGQLKYATIFLNRYPDIKMDIFYLSISSALSQISITYTIRAFGAVTLATVLTIRQVFSISLNAFLFHEPLVALQWIGLALILVPLFFGTIDRSTQQTLEQTTQYSSWDLKKLADDPVLANKTSDGRTHYYTGKSINNKNNNNREKDSDIV